MKPAKEEILRLNTYIDSLNNLIKTATRQSKIEFFKRDIVKTQRKIEELSR